MHKAINSFCRQLNAELKLSRWSVETAIHSEFVPLSQVLFLFHNGTGICDWATNLHRLETNLKHWKQFSVCKHSQDRALGFWDADPVDCSVFYKGFTLSRYSITNSRNSKGLGRPRPGSLFPIPLPEDSG